MFSPSGGAARRKLDGAPIEVKDGRIVVDAERRTTRQAGGDCVYGGQDLTVASRTAGGGARRPRHRARPKDQWLICAPIFSASNRRTRSGSPRRRRRSMSARSAPAGAAWCGALGEAGPPVVNVSGARFTRPGPDRLIAMNNIELRPRS
jgi:hypothetical protein